MAEEDATMTEFGMINKNNLLTAYGFTNGEFSKTSSLVRSLPRSARVKFGFVEGNERSIDKAEEWITAVYFHPLEAKDIITVEAELPQTKEGAMRLCDMWFRKAAINPDNKENYDQIIEYICEETGIELEDAKIHYAKAVEAELMEIAKQELESQPLLASLKLTEETIANFIYPIVSYFTDPTHGKPPATTNNYQALVAVNAAYRENATAARVDHNDALRGSFFNTIKQFASLDFMFAIDRATDTMLAVATNTNPHIQDNQTESSR